MVTFFGKHISKVDDKGRLVFPARLKSALPEDGDQRFIIKKSIYDSCLEMYTYEEWDSQSTKIKESLDFFNPDHVLFWREYMRDCVMVEPDPKLGRISIPRNLLDAIGVNREVAFLGIGFKIEIWAGEKIDSSAISNERYVAIAKGLSRKQ